MNISFRPFRLINFLVFSTLILFFLFCSKSEDKGPTSPEEEAPVVPGEVIGSVDSDLNNYLNFSQLSLLVPNSEVDIGNDGSFRTNFLLGTPDSFQTAILPVLQNDNPVLLTFACSDNKQNPLGETMEIGARSTALALVMMNPLFYGSHTGAHIDLAGAVMADGEFSSLVTDVSTAIQNDAETYLDTTTTYTSLYEKAGRIALNVYDAITPMAKQRKDLLEKSMRPNPYVEAGTGNSLRYVNPFYVYYGTGVYDYASGSNVQIFLQSPRALYWGIVPFVGNYGETVKSISEGDYTIKIYKGFNFSSVGTSNTLNPLHPSGRGTWANTFTAVMNIIEILGPNFAEGTRIESLMDHANDFEGIMELGEAFYTLDMTQILTAFIFFINENLDKIIYYLWDPQDSDNMGKYIGMLTGALTNVALPLKVLHAETKVPFFFDLAIDGPPELILHKRFVDGQLETIVQGPLQVTEPAVSTIWELGAQDVTITWSTGNIPGSVKIELYKGTDLIETITASTPNSGNFNTWDVPETLTPGRDFQVKVTSLSDASKYDFSDTFTIQLPMSSLQVTEPAAVTKWKQGQKHVEILWDPGNVPGNVQIDLYKGDTQSQTIDGETTNDGSYNMWHVPDDITPGTDYCIKITPISYPVYYGFSAYFEIQESRFEVTEPTGATVWQQGQENVSILWETADLGGEVDIALHKGTEKVRDIVLGTSNDGDYSIWDIPGDIVPGTDYTVRLTHASDASKTDDSEAFEIESVSDDPYEMNNTRSQGYAISFSGTPPTWQGGSGTEINPSGDQDWFSFTASEGDALTFICSVTSQLDPKIVFYFEETKVGEADDGGNGNDETLAYTVPAGAGGTYVVGIGHYGSISKAGSTSPQANTGSYELTIEKTSAVTDPYESNDTRASATQITFTGTPPVWQSASGVTIHPEGDQDWFRFEGSTGETITITCDVTSNLDAEIVLYAGDTQVANADNGFDGEDEILSYVVPSDGIFYAGIAWYSDLSKSSLTAKTGSYSLSIEKHPPGTIQVTEPTSTMVWTQGQADVEIHWSTGDLGGEVKIELYKGTDLNETIIGSTANDGTWSLWDVPSDQAPGTDYRVKITATSNTDVFDYSDYFTIQTAATGNIAVTEPSSSTVWTQGENNVSIQWDTGDLGGNVKIELYKNATYQATIVNSTTNDGSYTSWDVPSDQTPGTDYSVKITHTTHTDKFDFSDDFTIQAAGTGNIQVTEPTSSTVWIHTQQAAIKWETGGLGGEVRIDLYKGSAFLIIVHPNAPNTGSYTVGYVSTSPTPDSDYRIKITSLSDPSQFDYSDYFTIQAASAGGNIDVTEPTSSTEWVQGKANVDIRWNTGDLGGNVKIDLYKGGAVSRSIVNSTANDGKYDQWDVPSDQTPSTDYRVKITHTTQTDKFDFSDDFTIQAAVTGNVEVKDPTSSTVWIQGQEDVNVQWDTGLLGGNVKIDLYKGGVVSRAIVNSTANDGKYNLWDVPADQTPGTDYRVRVTHTTQADKYDYSDYFSIQSSPQQLAAPSLYSPGNGTTIDDNTPSFGWTDVNGADSYELLVDNTSGFSSPEIQQSNLTNSNYTPTNPLSDDTYYWKVRARNAQGTWGEWSDVWSFTLSTVVPPIPLEFISIEGGTFQMGSNDGLSDQKPVHTVTVSSFSISKCEVTNAQFAEFLNDVGASYNGIYGGTEYINMDAVKCEIEYMNNRFLAESGKANHPVFEVSWYGAKAFCEWAGGRLPTEAEWEYAARGGNQSQGYVYSGSNNPDEVAWYQENAGGSTHPVGLKQANELGLHDMTGNLYEWCNDWYAYDYYSVSPQNNPQGPSSGTSRSFRGGAWSYWASRITCAERGSYVPERTGELVGFRCVRSGSGGSGNIEVTEPISSTVWTVGQQNVSIRWDTGGLGGNVKITLWRYFPEYPSWGTQWIVTQSTPNDGSYDEYDIPDGVVPSQTYQIRIYHISPSGTIDKNDYSEYFEIQATGGQQTGTATDIDGNVYTTVKIGNQWWMAENLKVTRYRNGDPIPNVTGATEWINLTSGAYCNYDNSASYVSTYGRLYNWYAVNDGRNIAPEGWHVPSDLEWQSLIDYLGGASVAGGKMKEAGTSHWQSPNTGATNESGFSGLPGGYRHYFGGFECIGSHASFYSSTERDNTFVGTIGLDYNYSHVAESKGYKISAFSIRCVKD